MYFEDAYWNEETPPPNLESLFSKVLRPNDVRDEHAVALNINVLAKCPLEKLVPPKPDGGSYLPSLDLEQPNDKPSYADAAKPESLDARRRSEFNTRLVELRIDSDLAFRTLNRTVKGEVKPPRLGHLRKFWEGLENMSRYWDCSLDDYYTHKVENDDGNSAKRQRVNGQPLTSADTTAAPDASSPKSPTSAQGTVVDHDTDQTADNDQLSSERVSEHQANGTSAELTEAALRKLRASTAIAHDRPRMRYKGRRTSTGSEMPDNFRADTVHGLLEAVVWTFRSSVLRPRVMPRVHFRNLNLPVRQTAVVYRLPLDRNKARQGWWEGPILSIQTRPETDFHKNGPEECMSTIRLDLLREIGALLQLAQERHREGKTEVKPGEGKWWTTNPRWGGGAGGEPENEIGNLDVLQAAPELLGAARDKVSGKDKDRGRMKSTPAMLWKELKCGKSFWDSRADYTAIGKEPGSEYDEV